MNFKLTLQYDGTEFHGWQIQDQQRTVQGELTRGLSVLEGSAVTAHGSGRTDAGVHAEGQVASVNLKRDITAEKLGDALNGILDRDVRILNVSVVDEDFHARYSAKAKTYVYRIYRSRVLSPFWARYALHEKRPLDLAKMKRVARLFEGEHDWTAFSPVQLDTDNRRRNISELKVAEYFDERGQGWLIEIRATANGFLRYMVRSIAGTLMAIGRGELDEQSVSRAIDDLNREFVGPTAPPHGLTLKRVDY